jgi:hypothetical protein
MANENNLHLSNFFTLSSLLECYRCELATGCDIYYYYGVDTPLTPSF